MSAVADLYGDGDRLDLPADDECKFTVADAAPFTASTPYWREKAKVCKIVATAADDRYLNQIVADLHGRDSVSSGDAEYQRVRRFLNSHPHFFEVRSVNGLISARPRLPLLDLIKRGIIQNPDESRQYEGSREFCEAMLKSIRWDYGEEELITQKGRDLLQRNMDEYLERINDLRLVLHSDYADPEYITMPYKTRFNDPGRISKQHAIMGKSLDKAAEMYDNAVLLTLTTDPKKFGSVWEMWAEINSNWNRLMSWLSTDSRLGERPDYMKVLEATGKGMPHIHAIIFLDDDQTLANGMPWLESVDALRGYWGKYQGKEIDIQPLTYSDELPDEYDKEAGWVKWDAAGDHGGDLGGGDGEGEREGERKGQTAGEYLGKYLSAIYGGMKSAAGLEDEADAIAGKYEDKAATWKIALYWATRRKIRTESRDLRQAVEEDMEEDDNEEKAELADQIRENRYEFVGAYKRFEIPSHIRNGAVPVDSLMESLSDELEYVDSQTASDPAPSRSRDELILRVPAAARPLFEDDLEGSGMLYDDEQPIAHDDEPEPILVEDDGDRADDPTEYPVEVMTDEEREEAEEMGGFGAASFM